MTTTIDHTDIPAATETQLRAVLDQAYAGWQAGDADAFVVNYLPDAVTVSTGLAGDTREVVRDRMVERFTGVLQGSRVVDHIETMRLIGGGNAAVIVSRSVIVMPGQTETPTDGWVWATWTLTHEGDRWLVASYHNSPML